MSGWRSRSKIRQPRPEFAEEPVRIRVPLEADDGVVGVADHDHRAGRTTLAPLIHSKVMVVVLVGFRQQRRDDRALWRSQRAFRPPPLNHNPGLQPFGYQPKHTAIADPVFQKLHHPVAADAVEERPNVGVQDPLQLP